MKQLIMQPHRQRRFALRVSVVAVQMALCGAAHAGDWRLVPRLSTDVTYTDNVQQTQHDRDGDFINTVSPGLSVRGNSARLKTHIDYNWRQQLYADETDFNRDNHQLQADIAATAVKNWLYFDLNSRISQQSTDTRNFTSLSSRGRGNQLNDVTSLELAPRIEHNFGAVGSMQLGYEHQIIDRAPTGNGVEIVPPNGFDIGSSSSVEDGVNINLKSGSITGRMPVSFSAEARDVKFETGNSRKFRNAQSNLSYVFNREFTLRGTGGYDANTYGSQQGSSNGVFWSVGGVWTPSPRTSVEFDWGDRYFGKTVNAAARHTHRRWRFDFTYSTSVTTANQFERGLILVPLFDINGAPIFDPVTSGQIFVPVDSPNANDDVFLETRTGAGLAYTLRRGLLSLRYFEAKRESELNNGTNRTRGVTFDWNHRIRPRLSTNLSAMWRNNEQGSGSSGSGHYYSFYPSVSYELGPHTTARFQYELTINNGNSGFGFSGSTNSQNFYENAFTASLAFHL
ncbi:MAG: TIGR03016 family PEP-CTERM system-associated outer membrane protein [Gammaproteobacteria bacterium]|nr:TIGR03016 family PEP-CTERM system-associated outer membrane protein [Gammaproteobacteria bacterium]